MQQNKIHKTAASSMLSQIPHSSCQMDMQACPPGPLFHGNKKHQMKNIFMRLILNMDEYKDLLDNFVNQSIYLLNGNLTGIYLHGSAVMGCFNKQKSDIDLIVIIKNSLSDKIKQQYMKIIVELNKQAPEKGIELSIAREDVCNPFIYPTPFELHFSRAHLNLYNSNPDGYIEKMKGTDKDLAAHFTIIYHRGITLYGKEIKTVFSKPGRKYYFDSIWCDIENAEEDIIDNPMYIILNLCRVLAYKKDNVILSKKEGGEWGLSNTP